jgi:DNA polymerase II small subunit
VNNFRNRFYEFKTLLQERSELEGLVSVDKLAKGGGRVSIIGMVSDKRKTKNGNILLDVEDLTGRTRVLINHNKPELFEQAEEIVLDSVLGFSGFGDREIFFASQVVFPEAMLHERKKALVEECALFIGDIHYGSKLFLEDNFNKFIDYLSEENANHPEAKKVKYLFLVGDVVSGVGNYPGQQKDLKIEDLEQQFQDFANLLSRIRKDIQIIISPGNHDGVRLMEPQPPLDEKYAWPVYGLENVFLTGNPCSVNIGAKNNFPGFHVLTYHGFSFPYYANNVPSLMKCGMMNAPDKIMSFLLKNRHLAPTYTSNQYFPSEEDMLIIKPLPDIFVSGHSHKCAVNYHNNILLVSIGTWEEETEHQKKMGNQPDFCKVPMFNLKTRAIKILDFK